MKANKEDINNVNKLIESLNNRLKHISILQNEMAKSAVPNVASSSF
jgi:hypothetical protein